MKTLNFDAWLSHKLDEYKMELEDATVDFFIAENRLNLKPHRENYIHAYYVKCMDLANIAHHHGDEASYLQALRKIYSKMLLLAEDLTNTDTRVKAYQFARHSLKLICEHYSYIGEHEQARKLRNHFVNTCAYNRW